MNVISWCTIFLFSLSSFASGKSRGLQEAQQTLNNEFNRPGEKLSAALTYQAMQYYVVKTQFDYADEKWYRGNPDKETLRHEEKKADININHTLCTQSRYQLACRRRDSNLEIYKRLKFLDNEFKPQIIELPTIDIGAKAFNIAGKNYSFETGDLISSTSTSTAKKLPPTAQTQTQTAATSQVAKTDELTAKKIADDDSDYSCEWSKTTPRKVVRGPACSSSGARICTGYVTCGTSKRKADRLATCAESLCGDGQALSCAKQLGYGSKTAGESDDTFTDSKKLRSVNGAQ